MPPVNPLLEPLAAWLETCKTRNALSRNAVAVGIVVLDHLRRKCPLERDEITSARGEIRGARSGLKSVLEKYGIHGKYLREVTTRAGHQDGQRLLEALEYGSVLAPLSETSRDRCLVDAIGVLVRLAHEWQQRQHLKIDCDRRKSPAAWIESIITEARGRSGGKVEQHLVGAKLAERHAGMHIPNNPGHAGDAQTGRAGDFVVGSTAYHVTASPGSPVLQRCRENLGAGLHPVLLVPRSEVDRARHIAEDQQIADRVTILAIEDFVAVNIIEMSSGDQARFIQVFKSIITSYNERLAEVETDMSLRIEVS